MAGDSVHSMPGGEDVGVMFVSTVIVKAFVVDVKSKGSQQSGPPPLLHIMVMDYIDIRHNQLDNNLDYNHYMELRMKIQ